MPLSLSKPIPADIYMPAGTISVVVIAKLKVIGISGSGSIELTHYRLLNSEERLHGPCVRFRAVTLVAHIAKSTMYAPPRALSVCPGIQRLAGEFRSLSRTIT